MSDRRPLSVVALVTLVYALAALPASSARGDQASDPTSPAAARLSTGADHSCFVLSDATLRCWGLGSSGQLGYGNTDYVGVDNTSAMAGPVNFGGIGVRAVAAGDYHTCAILLDGSVRCWGFGANGRLGYGSSEDLDAPPSAAVDLGPGRTAVAIAAGAAHTCALLDNGSVECWGFGGNGQMNASGSLGYGTTSNVGDTPADLPGIVGPVNLGGHTARAITAGGTHTCVILDDGGVECWGSGADGELGYGNTDNLGSTSVTTPNLNGTVDLGPGRTAVAISAGGDHTCAILNDGSVECWGDGQDGQLGYGNTSNVGDTPADLPGTVGPVNLGGHTATAISAGADHTCAILDDGSERCWGQASFGRLGYPTLDSLGNQPDVLSPSTVGPVDLGAGRTALAISTGGENTCAFLDDITVRCWGYGGYGQLGYCGTASVGETNTPGSVGPINLEPGDGGQKCASVANATPLQAPASSAPPSIAGQAVAGHTLTEFHAAWAPAPTAYTYQWQRCDPTRRACSTIAGATGQAYTLTASDVGSDIRVLETAGNAAGTGTPAVSSPTAVVKPAPSDSARTRGYRACLATLDLAVKHVRALTHRGSRRRRAEARHRLARLLATGRARCLERWGRIPGRVTGLTAIAAGPTVRLEFAAPGTDGASPPPVTSYLVKQSTTPIRTQRDFDHAHTLCGGECRLTVPQVGKKVILTVAKLQPRTTYFYAVAARDNVTGRLGPLARAAKVSTAG